MARPREFDENAVLDAAVQCFWLRGYEATSIRALTERMNITGASLYNAFGDKRSLYRRALEHYMEQGFAARAERLETHRPPREAIHAFLEEIVELSLHDGEHRGCLLVNSVLEVAPHDAEFQRLVAGILVRVEAFFHRCVLAGQRDGSIRTQQPADDLARLLLGMLMGIRVLARARPEPELLRGLLYPAWALLDGQA